MFLTNQYNIGGVSSLNEALNYLTSTKNSMAAAERLFEAKLIIICF